MTFSTVGSGRTRERGGFDARVLENLDDALPVDVEDDLTGDDQCLRAIEVRVRSGFLNRADAEDRLSGRDDDASAIGRTRV
ncbi:hypothetical protein [Haloarcula regularis]|uniref:hypothetical protein n=1 Tax=Haloarcula regularis TaxID=3033392 RepID=UPI0023E8C691|nr:hypothetical protein [Halomicroarcula sp. SYNS111]